MTIAARLTIGISLAILVVSAIGMSMQYIATKRDLEARQATLLQAELDGFLALYDQRRIIAVRQAIEFRLIETSGRDLLLTLRDRNGAPLAGNILDWPGGITATPDPDPPQAMISGQRAYLAVARELRGGFRLLIAHSTESLEDALTAQARTSLMILIGIAIVSLVIGLFASRWVMRRVDRINELADRVAEGELAARLPGPRTGDEFGLLETHIHAMLDRIARLNNAQTQLGDMIAHELRTPLNRIQARLADLRDDPDGVDALQAEIRDTIRIFDSLLDIARAEADEGQGAGLLPVDLSALTEEIADLYLPSAEDKGLAFKVAADRHLRILGDRNLLAQLVSNLLDNAIKFCRPGDRITITLADESDRFFLTVADTGPGVMGGASERLMDRFIRASGTQASGHGLGLALVRAVAVRHGAKVSFPENRQGFTVRIAWPPLPDQEH
ncbi:MAG: HAMP domain-containing sensor histidine kinase [Pseudomonadota bacterium]